MFIFGSYFNQWYTSFHAGAHKCLRVYIIICRITVNGKKKSMKPCASTQ